MSPTVPPISTMHTSASPAPMRTRYLNSSRREIAVAPGGHAHEALVMTKIQVGLGTIGGDENLAMLERAHGAGIHVDVGIQLHHADLEPACLENGPQGSRCNALTQRGND